MHKTTLNVSTGELLQTQLSAEEIETKLQAQRELAATQYQRQRAGEYPPMADYIDGIVKGDQAQVQAYIDACLVIKAKYLKPE